MHRRAIAVMVLAMAVTAAADEPSKTIHHTLLTFYWIIDESSSRYRGERDVALYDARGHVIEKTTRRFRRELVREGYRLRVYVPFGTHWAAYFYRRVAERKENLLFALSSLLSR